MSTVRVVGLHTVILYEYCTMSMAETPSKPGRHPCLDTPQAWLMDIPIRFR